MADANALYEFTADNVMVRKINSDGTPTGEPNMFDMGHIRWTGPYIAVVALEDIFHGALGDTVELGYESAAEVTSPEDMEKVKGAVKKSKGRQNR